MNRRAPGIGGRFGLRGFTLIELMIAVTIVGILAAIAYPAYTSQMQKTRRANCEAGLMQLASFMERDYSRNNRYRDVLAAGLFTPATCPVDGGGAPSYTLSVTGINAAGTSYVLTATPTAMQAGDSCGDLTLNHLLQKGASGGAVADCW